MKSVVWLSHVCVCSTSIIFQTAHEKREPVVSTPRNLLLPNISASSFDTINSSLSFDYQLPLEVNGYNGYPRCDGQRYGMNLDRQSCFDAWRNMYFGKERLSWGYRGNSQQFDVKTPFRWSSDDGKCVVDVTLKDFSSSDSASYLEIRNAAERVMMHCIDFPMTPTEGGYIGGIGQNKNLVVVVRDYAPRGKCGRAWNVEDYRSTCRNTLSLVPVSMQPMEFVHTGAQGVGQTLPQDILSPGSECQLHIDIKSPGPTEIMRWFDIWAAAVAADAICVKQEKEGLVQAIGERGYGWLTLRKVEGPSLLNLTDVNQTANGGTTDIY